MPALLFEKMNWGLSVCSNYNLKPIGATIGRPYNQTRGGVSFEEIERAV